MNLRSFDNEEHSTLFWKMFLHRLLYLGKVIHRDRFYVLILLNGWVFVK